MIRIRKGFQGQRLVVFPFYVTEGNIRPGLQLHSMGSFPNAAHHYVERPVGCGEYVLIWCTGGEGWYFLDGIKHIVPKSHFFILPADRAHAYGSSESKPWSIYWAHFSGDYAPEVCQRLCGLRSIGENARVSDIAALFNEILTVLEGHADENSAAYVDMAFPRLMSAFLFQDIWNGSAAAFSGQGNVGLVGKASHFMNEHLSEKISLGDICAYIGYSESYFTRIFSKETGMAPMAYIMRLKVAKACRLLENTNLKINQIAPMLGFDDPYYFSKFFSKEMGMSPKEWRKAHQG